MLLRLQKALSRVSNIRYPYIEFESGRWLHLSIQSPLRGIFFDQYTLIHYPKLSKVIRHRLDSACFGYPNLYLTFYHYPKLSKLHQQPDVTKNVTNALKYGVFSNTNAHKYSHRRGLSTPYGARDSPDSNLKPK